jgi:hypothetical protein
MMTSGTTSSALQYVTVDRNDESAERILSTASSLSAAYLSRTIQTVNTPEAHEAAMAMTTENSYPR